MKKSYILQSIAMAFIVMFLSACANMDSRGQNEQAGMIIGGILGGVLGSNIGSGDGTTAAIIAGTMIGAAIGGNVGKSMDDTDRLKAAHTFETVRTGVSSNWVNPDTGNQYTVTPTRTYDAGTGPCREYTIDAKVGGKTEKLYGTACRQADGSWKVVNK